MGDATTTSFFPAKPLGCYGDGGAIFSNNSETAEKIDSLRLHGKGVQKYDNVRVGLNSRLDTLQAAILKEKLSIFGNELLLRDKVASRYDYSLAGYFKVPELISDVTSSWAQYTLIVKDRDRHQSFLKSMGIPTVVYYPIPLSKQGGYDHFPIVSSGVKVSERLSKSVLSLPMYPYLGSSDQDKIIAKVVESA
jgi:dTDP-4-amino-4,6-dideoxygalactose transaminase